MKKSKKSKSYLSANDLGITAGERKWLIHTMKVLKKLDPEDVVRIDGVMMKFDMARVMRASVDKKVCNTAGCIKGWMFVEAAAEKSLKDLAIDGAYDNKGTFIEDTALMRMMPDTMVKRSLIHEAADWSSSDSLGPLFYPGHIDMDEVTPKIASRAIESFLIDGPYDIDWGDAA